MNGGSDGEVLAALRQAELAQTPDPGFRSRLFEDLRSAVAAAAAERTDLTAPAVTLESVESAAVEALPPRDLRSSRWRLGAVAAAIGLLVGWGGSMMWRHQASEVVTVVSPVERPRLAELCAVDLAALEELSGSLDAARATPAGPAAALAELIPALMEFTERARLAVEADGDARAAEQFHVAVGLLSAAELALLDGKSVVEADEHVDAARVVIRSALSEAGPAGAWDCTTRQL